VDGNRSRTLPLGDDGELALLLLCRHCGTANDEETSGCKHCHRPLRSWAEERLPHLTWTTDSAPPIKQKQRRDFGIPAPALYVFALFVLFFVLVVGSYILPRL
jgi:hypothetical protein